MVDIIVNPSYIEQDVCSICLDKLDIEQKYKLPECGHTYHTNCIMQWVRAGHPKCPYCCNPGLNKDDINYHKFQLLYENDLEPLLRFIHEHKINPAGWVQINNYKPLQELQVLNNIQFEFTHKKVFQDYRHY